MWKSPIGKAVRLALAALFWLLGPAAFGQSPTTDQQVNEIKKQIRAIGQDTLRRIAFGPATDTARHPQPILFLDRYTAYYSPAGKLQQLVVRQQSGFSSATTRYYFVQDAVVQVDTNYINASRMGSCGQIRFHNRYYLSQGQLLTSQLSEVPTGPYAGCYLVVPAQELARLLAALPPVLARLPTYSPAK